MFTRIQRVKMLKQVKKSQVETIKSSKESDPYACAIKVKNNFFDNWMTVGHIPREISRHCFYFIQKGGSISGQLLSTNYKVSPIPAGGLEVPFLLTFSVIEDRIFSLMKDFVKNLYGYNATVKFVVFSQQPSSQDFCVNVTHITSKTFRYVRKYIKFVKVSCHVLIK